MRAKLVSLVVDSGWNLSFLAVVLAFTYCLFWWKNPFVAPWSCVGLFLRCSRSSSWPCRSEDFLLVKRKCNNCKRSRYQGSAKQESKTPRHKQQTPTQNQANPKENTLVPRCLGEKVKQMRPKIPALSPSPHLKKKNDFPCFFCSRLLGLIPGGAPFSQLNKGVKDAMVESTGLVERQFMTKTCKKASNTNNNNLHIWDRV